MPEPQNYKNHARFDPPFHFFLLPALLVNLIFSIVYTLRHRPDHLHLGFWWTIMSIAFLVHSFKTRTYALKVQDRVIRLEEQLRFHALLPADLLARSMALTEAQYVALRFASDAEVPALVQRALEQNLSQKQIKEAIVNWRADNYRV
jgi:hypothetical protein